MSIQGAFTGGEFSPRFDLYTESTQKSRFSIVLRYLLYSPQLQYMIISHDISNTTTQLTMIFANLNTTTTTTPSFIKQMYTSITINTTITTKIKR